MELHIFNFRGVKERHLDFDTGIHLLKGESGIGKSTCLEALQWNLYGGKNIYPFDYDKSKKGFTRVILVLKGKNMEIIRTKPPDNLIVKSETQTLEYDEAQKFIDQYFGSKTFWESSYYLKQDTRNLLLFGNKEEKNNIVKEIVFGSMTEKSTPDVYLQKTDDYIRSIDLEIEKEKSVSEYLTSSIQERSIDIPEANLKKLKKFYPKKLELEKHLEETKIKMFERQENEKRKFRKLQIELELKDYPKMNLQFLEKWKLWLRSKKELETMGSVAESDEGPEVLKEQIFDMERRKKLFVKNQKILSCHFPELSNSEENIKLELTKLENQKIQSIEYQHYLEKRTSVLKVLDKIKQLNSYVSEFKSPLSELGDINNLDEIKEKLSEMKTDLLSCPNCNKKLTLKDGKLYKSSGNLISKKKKQMFNSEYLKLQEFHKIKSELESLKKIYSEMKIPIFEEEKIENTEDIDEKIKLLRTLEPVHFSNEDFENLKQRYKISVTFQKYKSLTNLLEENHLEEFETLKEPKDMGKYFEMYQSLNEELKILKAKIKEEDTSDLNSTKNKLTKLLSELEEYEKYLSLEKEKKKLSDINEKLIKLLQKKEDCLQLKKIIHEESNITFENLMTSFNSILNDIVSEIFEDISIEIGMFKKLKSSKEIKPQFNMNVKLKGNSYDNLNFLSGGEKDRMSTALTITLSKLGKGNIVMIDETMSSLDEDMRHKVLELIKRHLPDKIILIICHFTVEGFYDSVVEF